ncbi:MAG: hypothetical protein AAF755_12235 [Pseudomonadota bacterium]
MKERNELIPVAPISTILAKRDHHTLLSSKENGALKERAMFRYSL